jgi:predicted permease
MFSGLLTRLRAVTHRTRFDAELDEELRYHLVREIERNSAKGMSARDARDAARRALGNVTVAAEQARDDTRWRWLEELRQDVAFAIRTFRRAPGFAVTVVATIALGLGLLSSAFTFFDAYVLRPLVVRDPASLFEISWNTADGHVHRFSWPQYQRLRGEHRPFSDAIAFTTLPTRVRGRPAMGLLVSGNYFQTLGVPPAIGRTLVPSDAEAAGANDVMVLSHHAWQTIFAGDSGVVGSRVNVNGTMLTVVGVAREGFGGLSSAPFDFWIPITMIGSTGPSPGLFSAAEPEGVYVVGRVTPGVTTPAATSAILAWLQQETSSRSRLDRASGVYLIPRGTSMPRSPKVIRIFAPVAIAFLVILLNACAHVANIMLARGMARQREIGIRLALGAGRRRLIKQLLTEAVILAMPAGIAGYAVSRLVITGSLAVMFATVPAAYAGHLRLIPLNADGRVFAFMIVAALGAAIFFGLAPALQATRPNIVQASRGDFDTQFRPSRLRNALVVVQITFSVLLLVCAGVLLSAARQTASLDPGIRTRDVVQIELDPKTRAKSLDALRREPTVRAIASSSSTPLDGAFSEVSARIASGASKHLNYIIVSPEYFSVADLPILRGRAFTDDEARSRAPVAVISRSTADSLWPGQEAIGQTLSIPSSEREYRHLEEYHAARVVGVTGDAVPGWIGDSRAAPVVYYPQPTDADVAQIVVRVAGDGEAAAAKLERALAAVDSGAVQEIHTLDQSLALQVYPFRAIYWVALALGATALLLTLIGVYGVMSYLVEQRRREFGIRIALGAAGSSLVALVLRQSLRLATIGALTGVLLATGASRLIASLILSINAFDALGYVGGAVVVVVACLFAAYVPARRAAHVDPVEALRAD